MKRTIMILIMGLALILGQGSWALAVDVDVSGGDGEDGVDNSIDASHAILGNDLGDDNEVNSNHADADSFSASAAGEDAEARVENDLDDSIISSSDLDARIVATNIDFGDADVKDNYNRIEDDAFRRVAGIIVVTMNTGQNFINQQSVHINANENDLEDPLLF